jgi:ABC-2 type transport system ATP-binding protein
VLLGLLRADAGEVRLLGGDPWRDARELHSRLAYVPGDVSLWPNLTGMEAINLIAGLRGPVDRKRRDELVDRFELDPRKKARTYSKGNRQKVALVAALCGDVELLLLDEPTSGLDPLMEATFQSCVEEATARGTSVLLSSHILAEVERLCDRVSIVRRGRTVETGTAGRPAAPDAHHGGRGDPDTCGRHRGAARHAPRGRHRQPGVVRRGHAHLAEAVAVLGRYGVVALTSHPPTLEELFLRHYDGDLAEVAS